MHVCHASCCLTLTVQNVFCMYSIILAVFTRFGCLCKCSKDCYLPVIISNDYIQMNRHPRLNQETIHGILRVNPHLRVLSVRFTPSLLMATHIYLACCVEIRSLPKITISAAERNFCVTSGPLSKYMGKMAMLGEAKCTSKRSAIYFSSIHVYSCIIASSMTVVLHFAI